MTELEKMQRAKMYIDKMANGINPVDDTYAADQDMVNNVRISRCLFYVSTILGQVIDNNGVIQKGKASKKAFFLSDDRITDFAFSEAPISVSEISRRLNDLADLDLCHKLKYSDITNWLVSIGALETITLADGKSTKRPTSQGEALGISLETRKSVTGEYIVVVYNKSAQQFILDNMDAIITNIRNTSTKKAGNQGQAWTAEHEECLLDLFNKHVPVSEMAATLMRTETGIRAKLKKMGLIDNERNAK